MFDMEVMEVVGLYDTAVLDTREVEDGEMGVGLGTGIENGLDVGG